MAINVMDKRERERERARNPWTNENVSCYSAKAHGHQDSYYDRAIGRWLATKGDTAQMDDAEGVRRH